MLCAGFVWKGSCQVCVVVVEVVTASGFVNKIIYFGTEFQLHEEDSENI